MQILELRAENFARLVAVEIRPSGTMVPITGKNRQGKTTVLKAIWTLVQGRAAAPAITIRKGTEECTLFGDFGAYKVTRTITRKPDGTEDWKLKIIDAEGRRITATPQKVMDGWLATLTLDPLEFSRMETKAQFDKLRVLVPDFDFEAKAKERLKLYNERTDSNRMIARYTLQAEGITLPPGPEPKPIDLSARLAELAAAERSNVTREAEERRRVQMRQNVDNLRDEAETLRARAAGLEKTATEREAELAVLDPVPAHIDTQALRDGLEKAQDVAEVIAEHAKRRDLQTQAKEAQAESDRLDAAIQAIDDAREAAIAAAKLPVDGLTLGDGIVLLNGVPLSDASTMEKIMTGAALGMALNPELKVMTIDEASELDKDAMKRLHDLAEDKGFSVWFTKVDEGGNVGFVIEDGEVASIGEMPQP